MEFLREDVTEVEKPCWSRILLVFISKAENWVCESTVSVFALSVELNDLRDVNISILVVEDAVVALSSKIVRLDVLS